ncbi:hypothetical protein ACFPOU_23770 [Massilia jejuensis]|uniref:RING-type E3 ubiquitin transferase n=1 Tax=Massilia jejuensis TaxID=648894 RepID=A0ABW0PNT5_9BURK
MLRSTKWIPNPPTLQKAIDAGHVGVMDGAEGRAYSVSKQCPDRDRVIQAIGLRKTLELMWICILAGTVGGAAVLAIWHLARWSNTF